MKLESSGHNTAIVAIHQRRRATCQCRVPRKIEYFFIVRGFEKATPRKSCGGGTIEVESVRQTCIGDHCARSANGEASCSCLTRPPSGMGGPHGRLATRVAPQSSARRRSPFWRPNAIGHKYVWMHKRGADHA